MWRERRSFAALPVCNVRAQQRRRTHHFPPVSTRQGHLMSWPARPISRAALHMLHCHMKLYLSRCAGEHCTSTCAQSTGLVHHELLSQQHRASACAGPYVQHASCRRAACNIWLLLHRAELHAQSGVQSAESLSVECLAPGCSSRRVCATPRRVRQAGVRVCH